MDKPLPPYFMQLLRQGDPDPLQSLTSRQRDDHPLSFMELLRRTKLEAEERAVDPMWRATVDTMRHKLDAPLREPRSPCCRTRWPVAGT
jgi:hypothetical protein